MNFHLAIVIAAAVAWLAGAIWYGILGKLWMAALDTTWEALAVKGPRAYLPFILAFVAELVMAWMLAGLLQHLAPLVDRWYLTDLPPARAAKAAELAAEVSVANGARQVPISEHASPDIALRAAAAAADPADRIVVFGSFYTVGGVLKDGLPRLTARHLG